MNSHITKYVELITKFKAHQFSANEFETHFLNLYKNDAESLTYSEPIFDTLDTLFSAVDEYCGDPELRSQLAHALDENDLLEAANSALIKLLESD